MDETIKKALTDRAELLEARTTLAWNKYQAAKEPHKAKIAAIEAEYEALQNAWYNLQSELDAIKRTLAAYEMADHV